MPIFTPPGLRDKPKNTGKNPLQDFKQSWANLSDEEKQEALNTIGELGGGTLGAIAGSGVASIPAAGLGAVAGKKLVAEPLGRALGLETKPRSLTEHAIDAGKTFALNAAGEGAGRAIPIVARGAKSAAQKAIQSIVSPDAEVVKMAEAAGVNLTPGMMSQRPLVKVTERVIGKLPGGMEPIGKATKQAATAAEANLRKIPEKISPTKASDIEVGRALKEGVEANRQAASEYFRGRYDQVRDLASDTVIDVTAMRDSAKQITETLSPDVDKMYPGVAKKIRQIAGLEGIETGSDLAQLRDGYATFLGGAKYGELPANMQKKVMDTMAASGIDLSPTVGPPVLSFDEAKDLRNILLSNSRRLHSLSPSLDKRAFPSLAKNLDASIEKSLTDAGKSDALSLWREVNAEFRKSREMLHPPSRPGKAGNPTAHDIDTAKTPERATQVASSSESAARAARQAASPSSVSEFGATPPALDDPIPAFRRNRVEDLFDSSRTQNTYLGDDRWLNPKTLERKLDDYPAAESVFGRQLPETKRGIQLSKAVASPMGLENTSNTSMYSHLLPIISGAGYGVYDLTLGSGDLATSAERAAKVGAGAYLLPKAAGKAWTSNAARRALTSPAPPMLSGPIGGMAAGLAGRAATQAIAPRAEKPESNPLTDPDWLKKRGFVEDAAQSPANPLDDDDWLKKQGFTAAN